MSCQETRVLIEACIDGELDLIHTLSIEEHMASCAGCRERYDGHRRLHEAIQSHARYFEPPQELQARVQNTLRGKERDQSKPSAILPPISRRYAALAAGVALLLAATALVVAVLKRPSGTELVARQVVAAHIRSLMANHLMDVPSTDQHTVKPWFNGKLDFAPVVKNLSTEGFPLVGGRLDYLDGRSVAALVYKRNQHTINLFQWPSAFKSRSGMFTINGYNVAHWTQAGMANWAVSDINAQELQDFMRDQRK